MKQALLTVIDSNSSECPAGSRVTGYSTEDGLVELAGHNVEDVTYYAARQYVHVHTALGYRFTISVADYHQLVAE
ncbi:MAG: hypothetical protein IPO81_06290 [Kouleothrix sp.]|nr:hypothetical protein [Kouleothrix sp.]